MKSRHSKCRQDSASEFGVAAAGYAANLLSALTPEQHFYILDLADTAIMVAESNTCTILFTNKNGRDIFGEPEGMLCWQHSREKASAKRPLCPFKITRETKGHCQDRYDYQTPDPTGKRWYDVRVLAADLPGGERVCIHAAADITKEKEKIAELCRSEERYRTIADYAYDWECWFNEEQRLEYVSPSFERITGYRAEEFMADPSLLFRIIHSDDRDKFSRHHDTNFKSRKFGKNEFRIITTEGKIRWISHCCQAVYDGKGSFRGRRSSNRDITEKKEIQLKLKLNAQRLSILNRLYKKKELNPKRICDFILKASQALTSSPIGFMAYLSDDESVVKVHSWSKKVLKECTIEAKPIEFNVHGSGHWGEAIRRRQAFIMNDFALDPSRNKIIPEGHVTIHRFLAVPLLYDNKVVALIAVGNKKEEYGTDDVTQLQLLLGAQWQILLRNQAEEEFARYAYKTRPFASTVAHDMKSPAIAAGGFARILKEKYGQQLNPRAVKYLEQIINSSEQIAELAQDINEYIRSGDETCLFEVLDLKELLRTIRVEFSTQLTKRRISWIEPSGKKLTLIANRKGLLGIMRNLIDNAFKYGGQSLSEIRMGYERTDNHHILIVGNNGKKIDENDELTIFKEFQRRAIIKGVHGSGLGLSIVSEIARQHMGNSWLTPAEDGSPMFRVSISRHLPVSD